MTGKLRNMTSIYLLKNDKILLLYRQGGKVVSDGRMNTRKNILSFMDNMDKVGEFYDDRKVIYLILI